MVGLNRPKELAPVADYSKHDSSRGFTLIEVLVTIVILAVGLLGLALLQSTSLNNQFESLQRAQALMLLEEMANRVQVNGTAARAGAYPNGNQYGLQEVEDCSTKAVIAERDRCEWNVALRGVGVSTDTGTDIGSIVGATGCIENIPGSSDGEAIVSLTIAWQGMSATRAPASECGKDAFGADDRYRRVARVNTVLADLGL
jgi:type IV pilus assembly protein PilV